MYTTYNKKYFTVQHIENWIFHSFFPLLFWIHRYPINGDTYKAKYLTMYHTENWIIFHSNKRFKNKNCSYKICHPQYQQPTKYLETKNIQPRLQSRFRKHHGTKYSNYQSVSHMKAKPLMLTFIFWLLIC